MNDELKDLLAASRVPEPSASLDARLLASFRAAYPPQRSRRIALPVSAFVMLLVLLLVALSTRHLLHPVPAPPPTAIRVDTAAVSAPSGRAFVTHIDGFGLRPVSEPTVHITSGGER